MNGPLRFAIRPTFHPSDSWWAQPMSREEFHRRALDEFEHRMRFSREASRAPDLDGRGPSSVELHKAKKRMKA